MKALWRPAAPAPAFVAAPRWWARYKPTPLWWTKAGLVLGFTFIAAFLSMVQAIAQPMLIAGGLALLLLVVLLPLTLPTVSLFVGAAGMSGLMWLPDHRIAEVFLAGVLIWAWWSAPARAWSSALGSDKGVWLASWGVVALGILYTLYGAVYQGHFRSFVYSDSRCYLFWMMVPTMVMAVTHWLGWRKFFTGLLWFAAMTSVMALIQAGTGVKLTYGGAMSNLQTMDTTYGDIARVAVPGILIVMFTFVLVAGLWAAGRMGATKAGLLLALYASCIYLNFGRAVWAATVLMLLIMMAMGGRQVIRRLLPALLVAGALGTAGALVFAPRMVEALVDRVLSVTQESASSVSLGWRVTENAYGREFIANHLAFGDGMGAEYKPPILGPGAFPDQTHYIHNGYYFVLIKGGIVFLIAQLSVLAAIIHRAWREYRLGDPTQRVIAGAVTASALSLVMLNFTQPEFSGSAAAMVMAMAYPLLLNRPNQAGAL